MESRIKPEELKRFITELDRILETGHGELVLKVADGKIVSWISQAQWELRNGKLNK